MYLYSQLSTFYCTCLVRVDLNLYSHSQILEDIAADAKCELVLVIDMYSSHTTRKILFELELRMLYFILCMSGKDLHVSSKNVIVGYYK